MNKLTLKSHAKINLTLEILGRLPSGYHQILSVMQELELHDLITLKARHDNFIKIVCDKPYVPSNRRNIAWKAANLLRQKTGIKHAGVTITIIKNIPVAGGLAGGSSNAAATLCGLNRLWRLGLSADELMAIGAEIGMDVPFFILGGTAIATERGEIVFPLAPLPKFYVVVANPGVGVSTKEAYQSLNLADMLSDRITPKFISALENGDRQAIMGLLHNDFEKSISRKLPIISEIKATMQEHGASNSMLSGSGSSVYCLMDSKTQAEIVCEGLQSKVPYVIVTASKSVLNRQDACSTESF
ncbi:MAG: 4-(cytidine 5'-diphospho)-2-C-methyl-D-erythritol kinase [Anaerolineaceae bacterium 4572_78]|nr:MAG: 4-(cytidine 5'-diphospho)-2-C-methyl-D-erythritol kinase [Anaerolineaceae bacterium 4572_78]